MVEIKAGPELNLAVAEAIGVVAVHEWELTDLSSHFMSVYECKNCGDQVMAEGKPLDDPGDLCLAPCSTDLNAAFAAAEKVGVFDENRFFRDKRTEQYGLSPTNILSTRMFPMAATPALALCVAILKLKEKDNETT